MRLGRKFLWWAHLALALLRALLQFNVGEHEDPELAGPTIIKAILDQAVKDNEDDDADGLGPDSPL
jgi:hypothetical protein